MNKYVAIGLGLSLGFVINRIICYFERKKIRKEILEQRKKK